MQSSTPVCPVNTPRRDLRLRGMPLRLVEAFTKLERSVGSPENSDATAGTPETDTSLTGRIYSLTTRLLKFVSDAERTKAENIVLRKSIQETKQDSHEKEDGLLREITKMKISCDEANTQIQNLENDLELSNANAETLRERIIELEKENLILERKSQNSLQQCQNLRTNLNKTLLEKTEIKESRNEMEVELAFERNRSNILAKELQDALQQFKQCETYRPEAADATVSHGCPTCAQRLSLEEKLREKIKSLEADLKSSRKDAKEKKKKLQAFSEELRAHVSKEKTRALKLARKNSKLAAERVNASQQLKTFEEILNKAHSITFNGDAHEDSQLNDAM